MNVSRTWDISFSHKFGMVKAKMNSYLNIPVYSLICPSNIKYENKIIIAGHILTSAIEKDNKSFQPTVA